VLQLLSGLSNVVLDWPMLAALLHTTGAAGFVALLVVLVMRARSPRVAVPASIESALRRRHA